MGTDFHEPLIRNPLQLLHCTFNQNADKVHGLVFAGRVLTTHFFQRQWLIGAARKKHAKLKISSGGSHSHGIV